MCRRQPFLQRRYRTVPSIKKQRAQSAYLVSGTLLAYGCERSACHAVQALCGQCWPALRGSGVLRSLLGGFIYGFIVLTSIYALMARITLIRQPYRQPPTTTWPLSGSLLQGTWSTSVPPVLYQPSDSAVTECMIQCTMRSIPASSSGQRCRVHPLAC